MNQIRFFNVNHANLFAFQNVTLKNPNLAHLNVFDFENDDLRVASSDSTFFKPLLSELFGKIFYYLKMRYPMFKSPICKNRLKISPMA